MIFYNRFSNARKYQSNVSGEVQDNYRLICVKDCFGMHFYQDQMLASSSILNVHLINCHYRPPFIGLLV